MEVVPIQSDLTAAGIMLYNRKRNRIEGRPPRQQGMKGRARRKKQAAKQFAGVRFAAGGNIKMQRDSELLHGV